MVDTITAPTVDDTSSNPKLSPIKYKKGSKNARSKNHFKSALRIGLSCFSNFRIMYNKPALITKRDTTMVSGLNDRKACLIQTKEKAQQIMDSTMLPITLKRSDIALILESAKVIKAIIYLLIAVSFL
jgi:hypothetical protein